MTGFQRSPPVPAHHPIRFLFAKQWHQEVTRQLIHHVQPQFLKPHLQQCPEPFGSLAVTQQQLGEQGDGRQRFKRHRFEATPVSVLCSTDSAAFLFVTSEFWWLIALRALGHQDLLKALEK